MKNLFKHSSFLFFFVLVFIIFRGWFLNDLITGGDYWYAFPSNYSQYNTFWYGWNWIKGNGFGMNSTIYQATIFDFALPLYVLGHLMNFPFTIVSKLGFFYPFLILSIISPYYLHKKVFKKTTFWIVTAAVYLLNTYILTIAAGGQILIGLTYALSPITLYMFMNIISGKFSYKGIILTGFLFGLEALLDLRYAYVLLLGVFLYFLLFVFQEFKLRDFRIYAKNLLLNVISPVVLGILLNGFWSIPFLLNRKNPLNELGSAYNAAGSVRFFSFATFENSISLLHPNWPENLFGKIYFMRPEFLLIPLIAYVSLFALKKVKQKEEKRNIIFFITLGLLGAFLSKGAQEPFGDLYLFIFYHIPGMEMFRDPTKFYTLTAISYSILIPYVFYKVQNKIHKKPLILLVIFFCFWLFLIRQAIIPGLSGTLSGHTVPDEYVRLEKVLTADKKFARVLWIPQMQRFGYYSETHPGITANDFLKTYTHSDLYKKIKNEKTHELLSDSSVGYVIVPYDSLGEIFLEDRKYSPALYKKMKQEMKGVPYLSQDVRFQHLGVFTLVHKDHFWSSAKNLKIASSQISPVEFKVNLENAIKGNVLVFSETYDPGWEAEYDGINIKSSKTFNNFNSFILPKNGKITLRISYKPQLFVNMGFIVSAVTFFSMALFFLWSFLIKKK